MRPEEHRQFRILFRDFLARIVDLEILSPSGDLQKLLSQALGLLAAFGLVVTIMVAPRLAFSRLPANTILASLASQAGFMIPVSMAVAGIVMLLAWNVLLPDRRDGFVLCLLPVRPRTIAFAKVAAIASAVGLSVLATNIATGVAFPLLAPYSGLRIFGTYWTAVLSAAWFVAGACLSIQAVAALVLSYQRFQRLSGFLQFAGFYVIVGLCLFEPAGSGATWLPSSWFVDLFQRLSSAQPVLSSLGVGSLAVVTLLAALAFPLAFRRTHKRVVEEPDIMPAAPHGALASICRVVLRHTVADPLRRAILLFATRTIGRSRQHRLLLAAYGGIGVALAALYIQDMVRGVYTSALWDLIGREPARVRWDEPSIPLLAATLILLLFAVTGLRAIFPLPYALRANWIFRVTSVHAPAAYFAAVRRCLYMLAVGPILFLSALALLPIWPVSAAIAHLVVLLLAGIVLVENSLRDFAKVPFACSYLPGKANLNVRLGAYALLFFFFADRGVAMELWAMQNVTRYLLLLVVLIAAAAWSRRRTTIAGEGIARLEFEDAPPPVLIALDLRSDAPEPLPSSTPTREDNLDAELSFHLRMAESERLAGGESPDSARRYALRELGNVTRIKEDVRAVWRENSWDLVLQDIRLAARSMRKAPLFAIAVVGMVALGIGVNVSVFLLFHGVMNRPLRGISAPRLVSLGVAVDGREDDPGNSWPNYVSYVESAKTFRNLVARGFERFTLGLDHASYAVRGGLVTANYFDVLGVRLPLGRSFADAEGDLNANGLVAVISHRLWQEELGGARDAVGTVITLNGHPATIVGVAPPGFRGIQMAERMDVWTPIVAYSRLHGPERRLQDRGFRFIEIVGQLSPGVGISDAQAELDVISQRLADEYDDNRRLRALVAPYTALGPGVQLARVVFQLLLVVSGLLLLVVCANVGNLILSRSLLRQHEMAVRKSLGAPLSRILSLLMAEGLTLAALAVSAGWILAVWTTPLLIRNLAPSTPPALNLSPDGATVLFGLMQVLAVTCVFTMLPAVGIWRQEPLPSLKSRQPAASPFGKRILAASTVLQLAAAVVLLTGAGLLLRTSAKLTDFDAGFPKHGLLFVTVDTAGAATTPVSGAALLDDLSAELRAISGVRNVSYAAYAPLGWQSMPLGRIRGEGSRLQARAEYNVVGPQYLATVGVPMRFGRDIAAASTSKTAVVSESLAEALWPAKNPLGHRIFLESGDAVEIVGVVGHAAFGDLRRGTAQNMVFFPFAQQPQRPGPVVFHIRHSMDAAALLPLIRAALHRTHPQVPIAAVSTAEQRLQEAMPFRFLSILIATFATGALLIAGVGLYGLIALNVEARVREFALRIALGATAASIWRAACGRGMALTGMGLAAGLVAGAGVARAVRSMLFGIDPADPATYMSVLGLLAVTSIAAALLPARRATQVDPITILRQE